MVKAADRDVFRDAMAILAQGVHHIVSKLIVVGNDCSIVDWMKKLQNGILFNGAIDFFEGNNTQSVRWKMRVLQCMKNSLLTPNLGFNRRRTGNVQKTGM